MLPATVIERALRIHQPLLLSLPALACIDPRWRAAVREYWVQALDEQQRCDILVDADNTVDDEDVLDHSLTGLRLAIGCKAALSLVRYLTAFRRCGALLSNPASVVDAIFMGSYGKRAPVFFHDAALLRHAERRWMESASPTTSCKEFGQLVAMMRAPVHGRRVHLTTVLTTFLAMLETGRQFRNRGTPLNIAALKSMARFQLGRLRPVVTNSSPEHRLILQLEAEPVE
jgi:hypothetical protein